MLVLISLVGEDDLPPNGAKTSFRKVVASAVLGRVSFTTYGIPGTPYLISQSSVFSSDCFRLRIQSHIAIARITSKTIPPTTPPAIAATGVDDFEPVPELVELSPVGVDDEVVSPVAMKVNTVEEPARPAPSKAVEESEVWTIETELEVRAGGEAVVV